MSVGNPVGFKVWKRHLGASEEDCYINPYNVTEDVDSMILQQIAGQVLFIAGIADEIRHSIPGWADETH